MKKIKSILLSICVLSMSIFSCACSNKNIEPVSKTACYFDTVITITLYCDNADSYIDKCFSLADSYEKMFSTTKKGSDIYNINHSNGEFVTVDDETLALIQAGISYAKQSQGSFDITVGSLSSLWQDAIKEKVIPNEKDISAARKTISWENIEITDNKVRVTNNAQIDLGGIAKGYIADQMKGFLQDEGITNGLINLGGNVLAVGPKTAEEPSYNIAIQKPFSDDGEPIAAVRITDESVVTSGTYQRYFEKDSTIFHHILDLSTGYPCDNDLDSVTIICKNSIDGDALSTTVFLMGLDDGMSYVENLKETEAIFVTKDGGLHTSSGIGKSIPFQIMN